MPETRREWEKRDEAALMFMQATIAGRLASGRGIPGDGQPEARAAYKMADAFLVVSREMSPS